MKKWILLLLLAAPHWSCAQESLGMFYVALNGGLSIREKPETGATVIGKIPYGTKISLLQPPQQIKSIVTEGIEGQWKLVKYSGKTGYVINSYVLPWPPPNVTLVKDMKQYLKQVSLPFGGKLQVKKGGLDKIGEAGWQINKQLYKNGAEWQEFLGYEYHSDVYILPDFTITQGFLLLRLIPEFRELFGEKEAFPAESKKYIKDGLEYEVLVEKEMLADSPWYTRIKLRFADGPYRNFEMYYLDNQLVIFYSSGV